MKFAFPIRGSHVCAALVPVLILAACGYPDREPEPEGFAAAEQRLRRGNYQGYLHAIGKGEGLASRVSMLRDRLDPEAFAIVTGCEAREYDLFALTEALTARDDDATREALGFGEQQVRADLLDSCRTVFSKRAGHRNFYHNEGASIDLLRGVNPPEATGVLAYRVRAFDAQKFVVFGHDGLTVTCLNAGRNLAWKKPEAKSSGRFATLADALKDTPAPVLNAGESWDSVEVQCVTNDGALTRIVAARDDAGWYIVSRATETLAARLERIRDTRLAAIFARRRVRPNATTMDELAIQPPRICDPTDPRSNLGWEGFHTDARVGFAISQREGISVECVYMLPTGKRRAITTTGELTWID